MTNDAVYHFLQSQIPVSAAAARALLIFGGTFYSQSEQFTIVGISYRKCVLSFNEAVPFHIYF
jgi:hypothetical protein